MDNKTADGLICKIGQGDMSALEELYNALSRGVYAFALSIVRDTSAAEDIMQDTFVRVYNAAPCFRAGGAGVSWVMRIAHNLAINAVKAHPVQPEDQIDIFRSFSGAESSAVDRVMINAALDSLSETERKIVVLHAVMGMKLNEISEIINEPLGTVKWRHSAAVRKLRKMLSDAEVDE